MSEGLSPEVVYAILNGRVKASGATQEQVNTAVEVYLTTHPVKAYRASYKSTDRTISISEVN